MPGLLLRGLRAATGTRDARAALYTLCALALLAGRPLLDGPVAKYVHVRWQPTVVEAERRALERRFSLREQGHEGRSYGYDLLDASTGNLRALVTHPAVDDTSDIDRTSFRLLPSAPDGDSHTGLAWRVGLERVIPYLTPVGWLGVLLNGAVLLQAFRLRVFGPAGVAAPAAPQGRIRALDGLRGLAALAVALFHLTSRFGYVYGFPSPPVTSVPWGHYGVHLFFLISGIVIFMTIDRGRSIVDFAAARVSRLYPAYWVAVTVVFLALTHVGLPDIQVSRGDYFWNLTMLQRFWERPDLDGVYWTLQVELGFYVVMGLLVVTRTAAAMEMVLILWLALLGLNGPTGVIGAMGLETHRWPLVTLFGYAPLFIAGVALGLRLTRPYSLLHDVTAVAAVALYASWHPGEHAGFVVGAAVLVYLAVQGRLGWLARQPLLALGAMSYPLYLLHQNLGYMLLRALYARHVPTELGILVALILVVALAAGVHYGVERPMQTLTRGWRRRWLGAGQREN